MGQSNADFVAGVMAKAGFYEKPLRAVSSIAEGFLVERSKIVKSQDYTPQGKRNAIERLRKQTLEALTPHRAKVDEARRVADIVQGEAVKKWRGEVDPAEVREQRGLVRSLDPIDVAGRLVAAVERGDRTFIAAVESTIGSEFPLCSYEAWSRCQEAIAERTLDDETRDARGEADALEGIIAEVEKEVSQ